MRKLLIIAVIVAALIGLFLLRPNLSTTPIKNLETSNGRSVHPDPSSATFTFEDEVVTLSAGRYTGETEETVLMDKFAYGDINDDRKEDAVLFLARYGGGSGTFIYLAAFVSGPVTYRGSQTTFLGDRIAPQSISIKNGVITAKYLDRGPDEPFSAEPTVSTTKQFIYRAGIFQER